MLTIPYLLLAIYRLIVSPIEPSRRWMVFVYRLCLIAFAVIASLPLAAIMLSLHFSTGLIRIMQVPELVAIIAIGEHYIFRDLERKNLLPPTAMRFPLGF